MTRHRPDHSDGRSDFLPPYCPELKPIERVWKLARRNCLHNRYFSDLSDLIEVVENQSEQWRKGNTTLHCLCAEIYDAMLNRRNRAANGDRDRPTARLNDCSVHGCSGCSCISDNAV